MKSHARVTQVLRGEAQVHPGPLLVATPYFPKVVRLFPGADRQQTGH